MSETRLIDTIGEPATLELMAEECVELAHACLKLARFERGENPTPRTKDECIRAVTEELADVWVTMGELTQVSWWDSPMFNIQCNSKLKRMRERTQGGRTNEIDAVPTVELEKEGEWEECGDGQSKWYVCPICHYQTYDATNFCPNCGQRKRVHDSAKR